MLEFARLNRKKDEMMGTMEDEGKDDFQDMGDESPLFRYVSKVACFPSCTE